MLCKLEDAALTNMCADLKDHMPGTTISAYIFDGMVAILPHDHEPAHIVECLTNFHDVYKIRWSWETFVIPSQSD